jgi:hypothetical protein
VGDFDGDARSDILWRNAATGENYVYLMNGMAITGEGYIRAVTDLGWGVAALGDYDGDGKVDVLWRHGTTGENYLYPMDGMTIKPNEGYIRTIADQDWHVVYGSPWPEEMSLMLAGTESLRLASGDEASTRIEYTDDTPVLTAGVDAGGDVDVAPAPEHRAIGRWDVRGLIGELKEYGFRLFGHTGVKPALFSTEGVELDAVGRGKTASKPVAKATHPLDVRIREGEGNDRDTEQDNAMPKDAPAAETKAAAKGATIDWSESLHGLGAALSSGKVGARGASHANFAAFEQPQPKKNSGR